MTKTRVNVIWTEKDGNQIVVASGLLEKVWRKGCKYYVVNSFPMAASGLNACDKQSMLRIEFTE